jgi:anti-sigma factor (TIGR02949 family)
MTTEVGCAKAMRELEEYLHHELGSDDAADIRAHMETCTDCAEEHHVGVVLTDVVRRACKDAAPEELRTQVLTRLRTLQTH